MLELYKLLLLRLEYALCICELRFELVVLALQDFMVSFGLFLGSDNHLIRLLEQCGGKIFQFLLDLLLFHFCVKTLLALHGYFGLPNLLFSLNGVFTNPHVTSQHFALRGILSFQVANTIACGIKFVAGGG
ncbi:hypothetical protein HG531_013026 [Fusarium graminearum]|nr:hypothetical protein HG531_013026 [Fusarium graminearum]